MPIYEYHCTKCGEHIEAWQKFSDPPLMKCGSCRGKLKKLISQSTFHLKGSGWYVTDYAAKKKGDDSSKPKSSAEGSSDKKSESAAKSPEKKASKPEKASKTKKAS